MKYREAVLQAIKEIKDEVLPELPFKAFEVINRSSSERALGFYRHRSCFSIPIIKLNRRIIEEAEKEFDNLNLYDIILTTILHELAHACQQLHGQLFDEDEAEDFAYFYWTSGQINKFWERRKANGQMVIS